MVQLSGNVECSKMQTDRLIYLFDPLCGWCYGAGPVLERLARDGAVIEALPTGLFSGSGARPMNADFAAYAWSNDQRIERLTGQPFSATYREKVLGARNGLFDSTAATLAVSAAGQADASLRLRALGAIQRARYVEGLDITDVAVLAGILKASGLADAADSLERADDALVRATGDLVARGKGLFHAMNANGVPALVLVRGERQQLLDASALFSSYDNLTAHLRAA